MKEQYAQLKQSLLKGGVAVLRTDTLYGIVACASNREAVERVYVVKKRNKSKPCIILVASIEDIPFDQEALQAVSDEAYGVPTSVVVPVIDQPEWLTRGGKTLAYRVPQSSELVALIRTIGALIAPSANPEGYPPARSKEEARVYFGDAVDYYLDGGVVPNDVQASRIISFSTNKKRKNLR